MQLHHRHQFSTPEGISLDAELAGFGTRALAALLDLFLIVIFSIFSAFLIGAIASRFGILFIEAIAQALLLVPILGYSTVAEGLGNGRTVGKRVFRLQCIRLDGAPMDLSTAFVRSVVRVVELLALCIPSMMMVTFGQYHQRLGDLVAGTVVIREQQAVGTASMLTEAAYDPAAPFRTWDMYSITPQQLAVVRRYLDRRSTLTIAARQQLGIALWLSLREQVAGAPRDWNPEAFLEAIVAARTAQGLG